MACMQQDPTHFVQIAGNDSVAGHAQNTGFTQQGQFVSHVAEAVIKAKALEKASASIIAATAVADVADTPDGPAEDFPSAQAPEVVADADVANGVRTRGSTDGAVPTAPVSSDLATTTAESTPATVTPTDNAKGDALPRSRNDPYRHHELCPQPQVGSRLLEAPA
eukprot:CAMPEP_0174847240 /NCGR_PEP_ID=MMETSP1114-20130205/12789_1 /TAXON_ID=312471 /ORGANISM="Neobodo designis, Strain CCAP 1951/1" /LENGTH=164 /DNA_ID=CAMNT_0016081511 /DNA_START=82 /DNA_END=573 /DNA_ORIENTATION=+